MKMMKRASKGQGIVEYAGALVVAAVLVAAVLAVGPDGMANTFDALLDAITTFFQGEIAAL